MTPSTAAQPTASLAEQAYRRLLNDLQRKAITPGQLINRRSVAEAFGMSVAPVLEAMLKLESEGLLETLPRVGTRVRVVTVEDVRGQLMVREALECQAARMYCGEPVRAAAKELRTRARRVDDAALGSTEGWDADLALHHALVDLADCPALSREFNRVVKAGLFFQVNSVLPPTASRNRSSHLKLVRQLQHPDPDQAADTMRVHLRTGKEGLL